MIKRQLLFLTFGFLSFAVTAQPLFFQEYYLLKKNEPVRVNKILQGKVGFLWLATDKGLFKFDGINYKRYSASDHLPDENVTALAEDSLGRVWAGFKNGGISIIDKNVITTFEPPEGMPKLPISDILFDKGGVLWFSTLNDGTYYFYNNRLYRLDDVNGMPDLFCYDLEEDGNGNIWIGTDGGVAIASRIKNDVEIKVLNYDSGLPDNIVKKILKGKNREMYVATEDAGLIRYDETSKKFNGLIKEKWNFGGINDLLLVHDWLWVATSKGLFTIDLNEKSRTAVTQMQEQVSTLYNDAEGNVWVGTKTNLFRTLGKQLRFVGPETTNVIAVTVDKDNGLWFSDGKTLQRSNGVEVTRPLQATSFASKSVISLFTDDDGYVWAGLYGDGVLRIDTRNGSLKQFNKELRNGSILNITGRNKRIWLATLGGATEIETDGDFAITNYNTTNGLSTDYIYQIFVDSKERVWFATDRNGVDMLDKSGLHHFEENFDSKVVYGFAEDVQHRVWANVQALGLFVFDEKKFQPFESQNRLHNTSFNVFTSDQSGQLIVAHELGLDFFDPAKKRFRYLDEQSGAGNRIANLNAVAKNDRGEIFVGTDHGLIVYSPQDNQQQWPGVSISQVKVNDVLFDLTKSETLSYDQNNIRIDFLGFWYQNPSSLNFLYQLENYDPEWISTRDNSAIYSKLPDGDYTFRLKVSDSNDFSGSSEMKIHFVVRPPFWRTNLFYILVVATIAIGSYFFIYLREKQLLADKRELELKVRVRTAEIEHKTHEIQAQAEEIKGINENLETLVRSRTAELEHKNKALEEYAFINAHQLRAPVASILGLIHLMQKMELKEEEKVYLAHLKESAKKLDEVVSSITEAIERGEFMKPPLSEDN